MKKIVFAAALVALFSRIAAPADPALRESYGWLQTPREARVSYIVEKADEFLPVSARITVKDGDKTLSGILASERIVPKGEGVFEGESVFLLSHEIEADRSFAFLISFRTRAGGPAFNFTSEGKLGAKTEKRLLEPVTDKDAGELKTAEVKPAEAKSNDIKTVEPKEPPKEKIKDAPTEVKTLASVAEWSALEPPTIVKSAGEVSATREKEAKKSRPLIQPMFSGPKPGDLAKEAAPLPDAPPKIIGTDGEKRAEKADRDKPAAKKPAGGADNHKDVAASKLDKADLPTPDTSLVSSPSAPRKEITEDTAIGDLPPEVSARLLEMARSLVKESKSGDKGANDMSLDGSIGSEKQASGNQFIRDAGETVDWDRLVKAAAKATALPPGEKPETVTSVAGDAKPLGNIFEEKQTALMRQARNAWSMAEATTTSTEGEATALAPKTAPHAGQAGDGIQFMPLTDVDSWLSSFSPNSPSPSGEAGEAKAKTPKTATDDPAIVLPPDAAKAFNFEDTIDFEIPPLPVSGDFVSAAELAESTPAAAPAAQANPEPVLEKKGPPPVEIISLVGMTTEMQAPERNEMKMPNLAGISFEEAQIVLEAMGLHLGDYGYRPVGDPSQSNKVAEQSPKAGETVHTGDKAQIVLFNYPQMKAQAPGLVGKSPKDARSLLEDRGFVLGGQSNVVSTDPRNNGLIAWQSPSAGQPVALGTSFQIKVYGDSEGGTPSRLDEIAMPNLVGLTLFDAQMLMQNAKLRLGEIKTQPGNNQTPSGYIFEQKPGAGTQVRLDSRVDLMIAQ